ncbi:four helix bundle protein [Flagellimonas taeanensis]|uniref:four helix bundle protein n=1 Tax=Flavobacteriaceae TaxID=49546 RepID=UPI000E686AFE|nr:MULTISPECIES: four helix bundle protein [Allomuricauda]MDC6385268.1 four helix bundle protein [Muricauda sp. SK9]RIV52657.1 four helix bundle protein [Allomuricauda taeanensis]
MNSFEELEIWKLAREICNDVWHFMEKTSLGKDYSLKNQMNASSGSIMDNVAEGFERNGNKEFTQFLSIAKASCGELRLQLYRCLDREHISQEEFDRVFSKTITEGKKIGAFMAYLKKSERKGAKYD